MPPNPRPFPPYQQQQIAAERDTASTLDKGHGRLERRTLTCTAALRDQFDWPGLKQVLQIRRERTCRGQKSVEIAYSITSLPRARAAAHTFLHLVRDHWGAIENGLHHIRDVALGEDRSTITSGHAPQNLAALRNTALNWLRRQGYTEITRTLRHFARQSHRLFSQLAQLK